MDLQRLYSYMRQAIDTYGLIEENDRIAIGISGGKDSLALLYGLAGLRRFYPKKFELVAITVHLGMDGMDFSAVEALCKSLAVDYYIVETEIYEIVFHARKEAHPCSLCAKLRKGALNDKALELGCNKIAYAHHKDDFVETLLMSQFLEGRIASLSPMYTLARTKLTLIRPMLLIPEIEIVRLAGRLSFPIVENLCPADGHTKRESMKETLRILNKQYPGVKNRIFTAIENGNFNDWPQKKI